MGLIPGKCPNCGASLKINESAKGELLCPFCGSTYLVENAVNIVNNEIVNNNVFNGANVVINQKYKDSYIKQYLENARRAFEKDDWEEVEKYYNMVEQFEPHNMEAVYFSAYGKAMLSLYETEYGKREQKIHVLLKSISVINDYYEETDPNERLLLIEKISNSIIRILNTNALYNPNVSYGLGSLTWYRSLMSSIPKAFLIELQQISELHDDQYIKDLTTYYDGIVNPKNNNGCYIATCVYGSYDCPEVWTLRRFRDNTLAKTWYGRAFIHIYYAISPTLVGLFGETKWFKSIWQGRLDKMVASLQKKGVESTPYKDKKWR